MTWKRASVDLAVVVEVDGDLGVPLDARHRVDDDALGHGRALSSRIRTSAALVRACGSAGLPSSSCSSTARMRSAGGGQPGR